MEELFGISMDAIMRVLLAIFIAAMAVVAVLALRNRIMLKMGLRNIPRKWAQTILIIVGVMLSTVIMSAAFGTGDTISFSIRNETLKSLGHIDEVLVYARAGSEDSLGSRSYIPSERFERIESDLGDLDTIDGLTAQLAETAPTVDLRTSLSEGQMRVTGVDPTRMEGFGAFTLTSGGEVRLDGLAQGEAYLNKPGAKELDAEAGDDLRLIVGDQSHTIKVKGVVKKGGLAGFGSTLILPLQQAQTLFDKADRVNLIVVSNRGDEVSGERLSEEVSRELRVLFADREVASQLKELLNQEPVLKALKGRQSALEGDLKEDISSLQSELPRDELSDELISLLADEDVSDEVLDLLNRRRDPAGESVPSGFLGALSEVGLEASTLFQDLKEFQVFDFKHDALSIADEAGSATTSFFLIMSLFSIMVGVLLIFLIFVMLAAARRSEMGMARAVGAKRSHLVKMFLFEGTAYAVVSAAVGVILGLLVSALIVIVINRIIATFDADFRIATHFTMTSAIVAYCLGMAITFGTILFSAYRVSRLNIVLAIRGLPEALLPSGEPPFLARLSHLPKALFHPVIFLIRGVTSLFGKRLGKLALNWGFAVLWVVIFPIWIVDIIAALFRFAWPYLLRGWLTLLLGLLVTVGVASGSISERDSLFGAGASLMVLGLGLMLRTALKRTTLRPEVRDRIAFTSIGIAMLVFWALPLDTFESITGQLQGDFDVMFVSGIFMVTSAVWAVMYNADLLLKVLTTATGRIGKLRPVLVIAVAYPMSAKFRTGLTLAMFALVIFTLMVMSVLTTSFSSSFIDDLDTVVGGWDIEASVNLNNPIEDIRQAIEDEPKLRIGDFEAIGGFTKVDVEVRQQGGKDQRWDDYAVSAVDDAYLDAAEFKLKLIADGYGPIPDNVWRALKDDPTLTVIEGQVLKTRPGGESEFFTLLEDVSYEDGSMPPVSIEVREPRTGTVIQLTVIGVLDRVHETFDEFRGMLVSKAALDDAIPFPVPIGSYHFKVVEGADSDQVAKELEASFLDHGMEANALETLFREGLAAFRAFINIFIGFMGLGLVVGAAAIGVVMTRAVVERRQQIGVLRAIGYRRRMVQLSFLLESSFVALFGTAIGVVLGLILSYNAISDIRAEEAEENLKWVVPWLQIGVIIVLTYFFSLLATYLPARQASRIYPAEALRYE